VRSSANHPSIRAVQPFWLDLPPICNIIAGLLAGFGLSLGIGTLVVNRINSRLKKNLPAINHEPEPEKRVPGWVTA
jgi:hypothetical protein